MSLEIDGVWKSGVWANTIWAIGVWREGVPPISTIPDCRVITISCDNRATSASFNNRAIGVKEKCQ